MTFTCDDPMGDDDFSEGVNCPRCSGWGTVNCHCGGDQCYCNNQGTRDCPLCYGEREVSDATYEAYQKRQREMMAAFHGVQFTYPHEKDPTMNKQQALEALEAILVQVCAEWTGPAETHPANRLRTFLQSLPDPTGADAGVELECPAEYAHPFFVYDFMPQKIMFKSERGDDTMALDVLSVRGWGHLIGHGQAGLKINEKAAAEIQDNFGKWVAKTLTAALSPVTEKVIRAALSAAPPAQSDEPVTDGFDGAPTGVKTGGDHAER